VRIDHVESSGLPDNPEIGCALDLRAFVSLGGLSPDDVQVQVLHGRVQGEDDLVDPETTRLELAESYEGGRHRFDGHLALDRTGPFGYTVRILPHHPLLTAPAELGLVALAD
jgi:starch phosphorylase